MISTHLNFRVFYRRIKRYLFMDCEPLRELTSFRNFLIITSTHFALDKTHLPQYSSASARSTVSTFSRRFIAALLLRIVDKGSLLNLFSDVKESFDGPVIEKNWLGWPSLICGVRDRSWVNGPDRSNVDADRSSSEADGEETNHFEWLNMRRLIFYRDEESYPCDQKKRIVRS